jgi:hypothetical protein
MVVRASIRTRRSRDRRVSVFSSRSGELQQHAFDVASAITNAKRWRGSPTTHPCVTASVFTAVMRHLTRLGHGTKLVGILVSKVRRLIVQVACAWLFLHVSVVAGTTVLLVATGSAASDLVCTCAHGADHTSCRMHHKPADSARCRLQSTQNDLGFALLSMLGPPLPVAAATVVADATLSRPLEYQPPVLSDGTFSPDPPPPRN